MAVKIHKLSDEKFQELKNELDYLRTVREKEVSDHIKEARSHGDLSENSDYDEAKDEQGKLYLRISEIEEILGNYVIVSDADLNSDEIDIGCSITVDYGEGDTEELALVGSQEADPLDGRISDESPIGKALLGHISGDVVDVVTPGGALRLKISSIGK